MTQQKSVVIEDVIYYDKKEFKENGSVANTAKSTFYYQFLMERADASIDGQNNQKAAEDFNAYEEIYCFLLEQGILNNKKYLLDWEDLGDYASTFTFNLTAAMEDFDIETMLNERFEGQHMSEHINTLINPNDKLRCNICGAVTLSRRLQYRDNKGNIHTHCLACYPIDDSIRYEVQIVYNESGQDPLIGVKERVRVIDEASKPRIAEGKTINMLIDEYKDRHKPDVEDERISIINQILQNNGYEEYEAFGADDFDIIILNRRKLADFEVFADCVATSSNGKEIIIFFEKTDTVLLDKAALAFAKAICQDETVNSKLIKED